MKFDFTKIENAFKTLFAKLKARYFPEKQPTPVPVVQETPKDPPKPPQDPVQPTPEPAQPNVIDALLGGTPRPVVPKDPVVDVKPFHADGFILPGSGNVVRNTLPAGTAEFIFTLPSDRSYQVDGYEVPGTEDGYFTSIVVKDADGNVETQGGPFSVTAHGVVTGSGKAGVKHVFITTDKDNSYGVVAYF